MGSLDAKTVIDCSPLQGGNFSHSDVSNHETTSLASRFSLKGRTTIVTGAAAGIGLAVAQGYAEMGANVAIWYNSNKKGPTRAAEIEQKYGVMCQYSRGTGVFANELTGMNRSRLSSGCIGSGSCASCSRCPG